ncbi:hypothetical protein [Mucilaginibacter lappiensis]|uniref:Uncharacterized protein n=1 Tax=Mucilaginibacter lappiensis TaxID=354630 RepID=A0A1N6SR32_9SPHI|nr:hypothetical protein [Mucilaginibacter lappiensis]MBB6108300.1 hypothetical protein [Mucilaginibacter lappiensis]MBB6129926.1 hypothetical protein [Mucilaginibacter lappiensis]SIQ43386.1 hypothetical protein SAMN05421821_102463 [Mucilaginibacter lappiensis]
MKQSRSDIIKKLQVLFIAACYTFIAVSHIFFLPRLTAPVPEAAVSHNSIFKRKTETIVTSLSHVNFFQRTDKFIMNDKKSAIDLLNMVVGSFILLLFAQRLWKFNPQHLLTINWSVTDSQYSYLSFCTFKI